MKNKQGYFWNGLLLTVVALLMRTVSVSFNVYVAGRVGAEAMGLLSLIASVYGFAVTLAVSGIHLATVRTVAEHLGSTGDADVRRVVRACVAYAAFFGTFAGILLFLAAKPLGVYVLCETRTVRAFQLLSATLPPIAIVTVMNGYFTAVRRAWKNALSQVCEQAVKISFTVYLLVIVAPATVEGCTLAILSGGAVSETLSLLFNIVLYLLDRRRYKRPSRAGHGRVSVVSVALPVAVSAYLRSGLLAVEHVLIPRGLTRFGAGNAAALASYGALHGMALPVVLYPAAILSSFAALLIPEMTEQQTAGNRTEIRYIAGRVYQMTLLFAIGTGGVMLALSGELGAELYGSAEVGRFIRVLAPLVPVMYLDTATDAMLKGLGQQIYSMNVNILDALVSVLCVWLLVPRMGINGYLVTIYVTEILNAALSVCRLLRITGFRPSLLSLFVRPLGAVVGATCLLRLLVYFFGGAALSPAILAAHIAAGAGLYGLLLVLTGAFSRADLRWTKSFLLRPRKKANKC